MGTANLPNEAEAWAADFGYGYLEKLYAALGVRFTPTRLRDAANASAGPRVFVRHDIDVSLERALPLGRLESAWGVPSTYHVMLSSPFYDLRAAPSRAALNELAALGHEVGLHYDVSARKMRDADSATREDEIAAACAELESILGQPVRSLSFHLPVPELVNGPLHVAGRVSGYAKDLFAWYLSDSRARWREGEPLAGLDRPKSRDLQILIHPIWWGPEHEEPGIRLRGFLHDVQEANPCSYTELSDQLWDHILYRAAAET